VESTGAGRQTAVLFAGIAAGHPAREPGGAGEAQSGIDLVVQVLEQASALSGGRIVNRRELGVMVLFATPDAAARAAMRMQVYAGSLACNVGIRIAFHCGPVAQRGEDIFGDTVNLALELAEAAQQGQILTTRDAASGLSPEVQEYVRPARVLECRQAPGRVLLGELLWREDAPGISPPSLARTTLRLAYRNQLVLRRRQGDTVTIGRDTGCDLVVEDLAASRKHCTILRCKEGAVLKDHSANGTFVAVEHHGEVAVRGEAVALPRRGAIAFGRPCRSSADTVRFACE